MLGFSLCTAIFTLALLSVNLATETELVETGEELARNEDQEVYWVGLYKPGDHDEVNEWQTLKTEDDVRNVRIKYYDISGDQCSYISGSSDILQNDWCQKEHYSICEQEVSCKPGYYGHKCERECHCLRELCDQELENGPESLVCEYGCQANWTGVACDIEKKHPALYYYCINSAEYTGKYVYVRIDTKGLQYRAIYGLTSNKVRGKWCNFTTTERHSSDLTTIRIPVNNISMAQMSSGECAGQQVGEDTFSWSIVLKEYGGYIQELDAQFKITCDFSVADNLERAGEFSLEREEIHVDETVIDPESVHDDVALQLIDSSSGKSIKQAAIGTPVILEMKYALQQGSVLLGVLPHNCVVYTPDGKYHNQLLDKNGCRASNSPVESFRIEEENKIKTPWFKMFTFENETSVTFRCAFDLCLTSDCKVGCRHKSRKRRDTQDVTDEVAHSTTRTIRVLPSIPATGDSQAEDYQPARPPAAPPGYDLGPFVYLNPVTCSLFLLILLVILCMYIAFIRTLRKSVYDIRKEIEVKRSRDKFLHCGCAQQKDRDYVAP